MAKAALMVGFVKEVKDRSTGIVKRENIERKFRADVQRSNSNVQSGDKVNVNLRLDMSFQIKLDKFTFENFQWIRYVVFNGTKWSVTNVQTQRPRLIVQTGGVYNG